MQAITSHLATYLLLIHMVLGCCFHHAHACARECWPAPAATVPACVCHEHGQKAVTASKLDASQLAGESNGSQAGSTLANPPNRRHEHECEGDHCHFVVASRAATGHLYVKALGPAVAIQPDHKADNRNSSAATCIQSASSSLRSHLRLRILLI